MLHGILLCNNLSKLTWKFALVLNRAVTYCHSTVYCSKGSVMPNYSWMPSVVTGYCKNLVAFLQEMLYRQVCNIPILIHEHVPIILREVTLYLHRKSKPKLCHMKGHLQKYFMKTKFTLSWSMILPLVYNGCSKRWAEGQKTRRSGTWGSWAKQLWSQIVGLDISDIRGWLSAAVHALQRCITCSQLCNVKPLWTNIWTALSKVDFSRLTRPYFGSTTMKKENTVLLTNRSMEAKQHLITSIVITLEKSGTAVIVLLARPTSTKRKESGEPHIKVTSHRTIQCGPITLQCLVTWHIASPFK